MSTTVNSWILYFMDVILIIFISGDNREGICSSKMEIENSLKHLLKKEKEKENFKIIKYFT